VKKKLLLYIDENGGGIHSIDRQERVLATICDSDTESFGSPQGTTPRRRRRKVQNFVDKFKALTPRTQSKTRSRIFQKAALLMKSPPSLPHPPSSKPLKAQPEPPKAPQEEEPLLPRKLEFKAEKTPTKSYISKMSKSNELADKFGHYQSRPIDLTNTHKNAGWVVTEFTNRETACGFFQTSGHTLGKYVDGRFLSSYKAMLCSDKSLMITEPNTLHILLHDLEKWTDQCKKMNSFDDHLFRQKHSQLLALKKESESDPSFLVDNTLFVDWTLPLANELTMDKHKVHKSKVFYHIPKQITLNPGPNESVVELSNTFYWLEFSVTLKGKKLPIKMDVNAAEVDEMADMLAGMSHS